MFDLIFLLNSNLPFENNEITKEKVIAGVLIVFIYLLLLLEIKFNLNI